MAYLRSGDPNQRIVIGGNPNTLGRWDGNRGLLLQEYVNNPSGNVPLVVGPSGTMILSHTFNNVDMPVHVRASDMRELLRMQPASARITCMAADNPMHNLVAGLSNNLVGHWDVRTGAYRKEYVSNDNVITVALDGQGTRLVVVGDNGIVRILNIQREEFLGTLMGHDCPVRAAAFAPDQVHVLTGDDRGTLRLWKLTK